MRFALIHMTGPLARYAATRKANVRRGSIRAPMMGASQTHGGSFTIRASFAYGKLDTIANASSATPPSTAMPGIGRSIRTVSASTAAAIVVGTPQKNLLSLGDTLNRASRIAAHPATSMQATAAAPVGTEWA